MANPSINPLPQAPNRAMARTVYPVVADAWAAAIGPWTTQVNDVVTWMGSQATDVATFKDQAAASAKAAAKSVTDASAQVDLATTQAGNAKTSADAAKASSDSAQVFAAAAGSAAGLGSLAGNAGKAIVVDANEKSVSYQDVGLRPGDYLYSSVNPGASYVPIAAGLTANQAAYPKLFARLGTLIDWTRNLGTYQPNPTGITAKNGNTMAVPTNEDLVFARSLDGGGTWAKFTVNGAGATGNGYLTRQIEFFKGTFFVSLQNQRDRLSAFSDISGTSGNAGYKPLGINGGYDNYIAQGNGLLVSWHPGDGVSISSDGVNFTFTPIASAAGSLSQYTTAYLFKFVAGYFWACGGPGYIFRSANGKDWTRFAIPSGLAVSGIEALPSGRLVIMATAQYAGPTGNVFHHSDNNGQTWSAAVTVPFNFRGGLGLFNGQAVCGGSISVAGTTLGVVAFSADGATWTYYSGVPGSQYFSFLWWPTQLSGNKLNMGNIIIGQHYDPAAQFWIPPLP
ncbi:hypothetical protein, partial [Pseudomonas sp. LA5]|uniref:hypothetical protein n=1 Tax=Pseudomonas sp. LA5 TaxID=3027850 RepID=UPI00235EDB53